MMWFDRIVTGGILFLILFTPFAFGSVHPWAYSLMEGLIFVLVIVWMAKTLIANSRWQMGKFRISKFEFRNWLHDPGSMLFALPLALFILFCLFQLVPLPPSVLRIISPQTFELYSRSLPGWPEQVPYAELGNNVRGEGLGVRGLGRLTPYLSRFTFPEEWLPLSVAPYLTRTDLLKFTAYAALFFLVLLYPFGDTFQRSAFSVQRSEVERGTLNATNATNAINAMDAERGRRSSVSGPRHATDAIDARNAMDAPRRERREAGAGSAEEHFFRSVVFVVLFTGFLVAAIGFIERFTWNGMILWFFVPYDWGGPMVDMVPRASGPFINADHFANYLSLIFPLALACALFRTFIIGRSAEHGLRIFCASAALLLFIGMLLSLSRAGWVSALLGIALLLWLSPSGSETAEVGDQRSEVSGWRSSVVGRRSSVAGWSIAAATRVSGIVLCLLLMLSLFFVGPSGREQVDVRLGETAEDTGLGGRAALSQDTLSMVRDFPLFGVGLGAWPELFARYRRPPWSSTFYREAHNDYVELLAGTGVIGLGLLACFFFLGGRRIVQELRTTSSRVLPLIGAMLASLGAMAFHEWFDFNLQIPANAFLFTLLFALSLRMATAPGSSKFINFAAYQSSAVVGPRSSVGGLRSAVLPLTIGVAAAALLACALMQDQVPYPYYLPEPQSLAEAKELFLSYPTQYSAHLTLVRLRGNDAPLPWQLNEIKTALSFEPNNPYIRDAYASTLVRMGRPEEGLREVTRSIADSPFLDNHAYLRGESLAASSAAERSAMEKGFKEALARSYPDALNGLAGFYSRLGRFSDQGMLYEQAAQKESDGARKADLLMKGGQAYLRAAAGEQGAGSKEQSAKSKGERADGEWRMAEPSVGGPRSAVEDAERLWRSAIAANPTDPKAYQQLTTAIYGPKKNFAAAKEIISEGIKNGAPVFTLYLSLAEAAQQAGSPEERKAALESAKAEVEKVSKEGQDAYPLYLLLAEGASRAGDREEEMAALLAALELRPRSSDTLFRVANLYLGQQKFDRAALYYGKIASINPNSADVYYHLAEAEEGRYRFADADKAYAKAVELAPDNGNYRQRYESLKGRVEQNRKVTDQ